MIKEQKVCRRKRQIQKKRASLNYKDQKNNYMFYREGFLTCIFGGYIHHFLFLSATNASTKITYDMNRT